MRRSGSDSFGGDTGIEATHTHTTEIPRIGVSIKFHKGLHIRDPSPFWGLLIK